MARAIPYPHSRRHPAPPSPPPSVPAASAPRWDPFRLVLKSIFVLALLAAAILGREILFLGFFGLLLGVLFSFPVGWFSRVMPRGVAVLLTLALFLGAVGGVGALAVPTVSHQVKSAASQIPEALDRLKGWYAEFRRTGPVDQLPPGQKIANKVGDKVAKAMEEGASVVFPAAKGLAELATTAVLIVVLGAFLVHQPDVYRRGVRRMVPRRHEAAFDEADRRLCTGLRHWVGGILVSMTIMGAVTAVGLWAAGIQDWFLLALLTFVGTFVPYLGAIASAVPGLLIGLAQSPRHFLLACVVYLGVHLVEGYIVQPLIMKRAVELRPALLLTGQAMFGALFGVLGVIVATPLMVCLQIAVEYLYVERALGK